MVFENKKVFGNFGLFMILKGSVRPLSIPHLNRYQSRLPNATPEPNEDESRTVLLLFVLQDRIQNSLKQLIHIISKLNAGDCFGTLVELVGRELTTKMFRAITLEDKCEFLKFSIEGYKKVSQVRHKIRVN